jgi:hypothetical protein
MFFGWWTILEYQILKSEYNDLELAIVSSESLAPKVCMCWRRAKARERGGSVVGASDRVRQARADGESKQQSGIQAAVQQATGVGVTHLGEARGRFLVENGSGQSLKSGRRLHRPLDLGGVGCERLMPFVGLEGFDTSHFTPQC